MITLIIGLSAPIPDASGGLFVWWFKSKKEEHLAVGERVLECKFRRKLDVSIYG
mgnify:CR=1 FL=1